MREMVHLYPVLIPIFLVHDVILDLVLLCDLGPLRLYSLATCPRILHTLPRLGEEEPRTIKLLEEQLGIISFLGPHLELQGGGIGR